MIDSHLPTYNLMQPPHEVFKRGLQSVRMYFKDMALSKRVKHSRKRYVFCGMMLICVEFSEYFYSFENGFDFLSLIVCNL